MHSHPVDVALLSLVIGRWLNLEKKMLEKLVRAGLLHDIGKAKVKDSILNKTEILTKEEMEKLKSHPLTAYKILENIKDIETEVLQGVLFHHERMDGSGYPLGLKEEKINLFSRIIAIADVFDAITANKAYRPKSSPLKALDEIQADSKRLDTEISNVFIKNIIEFYIGKAIRLSNEQVANIVKINPVEIARPVVTYENAYLDLSVEKNIEVVDFI